MQNTESLWKKTHANLFMRKSKSQFRADVKFSIERRKTDEIRLRKHEREELQEVWD